MANDERINEFLKRLENVTVKLESVVMNQNSVSTTATTQPPPANAEVPNLVKLYDDTLNGPLSNFIQLSEKIGGDVGEVSKAAKSAFDVQRLFLWKAVGISKPNDDQLIIISKPIRDKIESIDNLKNTKRTSPFFNHISAVAEGIQSLCWITVSPTPAPFIKEISDASQFYTNRVLKDFKDKEPVHSEWAKAWLQILAELQKYVKQNHTTGLVWNSNPGCAPVDSNSASGAKSSSSVRPPPPPHGLPPPPPPPPILPVNIATGESENSGDTRAALFADINKGLDVTKGLKKVTDDMKTHKNPALKAGPGHPPPKPPKPSHLSNGSTPSSAVAKHSFTTGPSKLELEGDKKWVVENFKDNRTIVVNITDMKQVVYIFKCINCVIQVKGKANSIMIDSCKKTSLVFDDLVSSVEVINGQSMQIQAMGTMPILAIQKTDGCQVYLSLKSLNAEIVTSKSSEMNILVPDETGEFTEFPVPEQYKTVWTGKNLVTNVVDIA